MRLLIILAALLGTLAAAADPLTAPILEITRIYTGDDKLSHFADGAVALELQDFGAADPSNRRVAETPGQWPDFRHHACWLVWRLAPGA